MQFSKEPIDNAAESARLHGLYVRTVLLVLCGYIITQLETAAAIYFRLTGMTYGDMLLPASGAIGGTVVFAIIIYLKKNPTRAFGTAMFLLQYPLFIAMYSLWIYRLQEIRIFGLFCALVAVVFVMFFTSVWQSLSLSLGTLTAQVAVSAYAVCFAGQKGDFPMELFYTIGLLPPFISLSIVARFVQKKSQEIQVASRNFEITNAKLKRMNVELHRAREVSMIDMELASAIQRNLMPDEPPRSSGWDVAFSYKPKFSVSGDFYDFYYDNGELRGIALFDVSGHGVSAGLLTMIAKPMLFRHFRKKAGEPLHRLIEEADRELSREIEGTHGFATGIVLRINGGSVEYVNAGHPDLILKKADTGEIIIPGSETPEFRGKPLGMHGLASTSGTATFPMQKGDVLLLYSDCLVEGSNSDRVPYGTDNLMESFRNAPDGTAQEILTAIINGFNSYADSAMITDDFTVILAKRLQ